jgi:hypothetical protein
MRRDPSAAFRLRMVALLFLVIPGASISTGAVDWSVAEQQLARKIVAVAGAGPVSITFENRSSLTRRESEIIQNGLRSTLETMGTHFAKAEVSSIAITISLSENLASYVWVAEIRHSAGDFAVAMVSAPRPEGATGSHESVPLSLRKIALWTEVDPVLDVAVLEESATPTRIAVLNPEKVSLYRWQGGKWIEEQSLPISHAKPWPRDPRGRVVPARDHLLDVFLPGVVCHSTGSISIALRCNDSDDPWPLVAGAWSGMNVSVFPSEGSSNSPSGELPEIKGFFSSSRNFFTGALTPGVGKFTNVPKFYSAAPVQREKSVLWLFAALDGHVHTVDGVSDQPTTLPWGSDVTSVRTACGAGWQVLATSVGEQPQDSIRAYEIPDRDPVTVSAAVDFSGGITALWTEARGDTAVAVTKDRETGSYEAFRLALACSR